MFCRSFVLLLLVSIVVQCQSLNETTQCQLAIGDMTGAIATYPSSFLMQDAAGKGSFGIYIGMQQLMDPGKWDQCVSLGNEAQYCLMKSEIPIPTTNIDFPSVLGSCVPSTCTAEELETFSYGELRDSLGLPSLGKILDSQRNLTIECRTAPSATTGTWVITSLILLLIIVVITSTILDAMISSRTVESYVLHKTFDSPSVPFQEEYTRTEIQTDSLYYTEDEHVSLQESSVSRKREKTPLLQAAYGKPSEVEQVITNSSFKVSNTQILFWYMVQFFVGWSAIKNLKSLFIEHNSPVCQRFRFFQGIKTLSTIWMTLGVSIYYVTIYGWINIEKLSETESSLLYQLYANSSVYSADIFWMLSALVITYKGISAIKQKPVCATRDISGEYYQFINVPLYIIRRLIRIWPSLALGVFFYWYCSWIFGKGPYWPWYYDFVDGQCDLYWWSSAFFISSLYPEYTYSQLDSLNGCFDWSWYISIQIMCFMITPFLIFLYYKRKSVGIAVTSIIITLSIICGILICYFYNLTVGIGPQTDSEHGNYFNLYYNKPYTRCHSYFFGVLIAFILHAKPQLRVPWLYRVACYTIITPITGILFFITYDSWESGGWSDTENILFAGLHHPIFSCCFAVAIFLMSLGYEGPLNLRSLFSHSYWLPLSRLSFGVYLYAPVIALTTSFSAQISLAYTTNIFIANFLALTIISYAAALVQYLIIEVPLLNSFDFFVDLIHFGYAKHKTQNSTIIIS